MAISTGSLVAGILIQDELQRQGEDTLRRKDLEHGQVNGRLKDDLEDQQRQTKRLAEEKVAAEKNNKKLQSQVADLDDDVDTLQEKLRAWIAHANGLQDKVNGYRQLMCESLRTIAEKNPDFKKTFDAQMVVLGDWIISQKSYKELAIQLGERLNIDSNTIIELGTNGKLEVLKNSHNSKHGTNASDSEVASRYQTELYVKIEAENKP
jgi:predicted nuclease with TOPRIM domain